MRWLAPALLAGALMLGGHRPAQAFGAFPAACPAGMPADVVCWRGEDDNGAHVLLARPADWSGRLMVHIHGGPRMARPGPHTSDEDLLRDLDLLRHGWAFAATSRRAGGFGVLRAAEDAEQARRAAVAVFGQPRLTILRGQSWGGNVAARAIEAMNAPGPDGRRPYDGALLTAGVLAGPTRGYDMRVDLRAAFQAVCGTLPARGEPAYTVTLGQARGYRLTREQVIARYLACTGADKAPEQRSAAQRRALSDLAAASRIPEAAIPIHLWWATQVFADIAWTMTGGRSAFGNAEVQYRGTSDDAAFNARVPRISPDPAARALLAADGDPTGRITVPVLTLHGIGDMTVFVEHQAAYRETVARAGMADRLVQVFVDEDNHTKLSPVLYPAALDALAAWIERGEKPTPAGLQMRCLGLQWVYPGDCRIVPDYVPQPWEARVNPRSAADTVTARR
jgi:alpha-beta hydrolase superfamily lysophospholipase